LRKIADSPEPAALSRITIRAANRPAQRPRWLDESPARRRRLARNPALGAGRDSSAFAPPRTGRDSSGPYPPSAGPFHRNRQCAPGSRCESTAVGRVRNSRRSAARARAGRRSAGGGCAPRIGRAQANFFTLKRLRFLRLGRRAAATRSTISRDSPTRSPHRPLAGPIPRNRPAQRRQFGRVDNRRARAISNARARRFAYETRPEASPRFHGILPAPAGRGSHPAKSAGSDLPLVAKRPLKCKPPPALVGYQLGVLGRPLAGWNTHSWGLIADHDTGRHYPPSAGPFSRYRRRQPHSKRVPFQLVAVRESSIPPDPTRSNPVGSRGSLPPVSAPSPAKTPSCFQLLRGVEIIEGDGPSRGAQAGRGRIAGLRRAACWCVLAPHVGFYTPIGSGVFEL